jgi:hypothetical protein
MDASIAYAIGGLVGSALRVLLTNDQETFSKKSISDIVVGGAVGLLFNIYPVIELPANATLLQQASLVGFIAYATGDLFQSVLGKITKK